MTRILFVCHGKIHQRNSQAVSRNYEKPLITQVIHQDDDPGCAVYWLLQSGLLPSRYALFHVVYQGPNHKDSPSRFQAELPAEVLRCRGDNVAPKDTDTMYDYRNNEICARYQGEQTKD